MNGKFNVQGIGTTPNGSLMVGEWKNNSPWNITGHSKDGNIIGKWVNGEQQ